MKQQLRRKSIVIKTITLQHNDTLNNFYLLPPCTCFDKIFDKQWLILNSVSSISFMRPAPGDYFTQVNVFHIDQSVSYRSIRFMQVKMYKPRLWTIFLLNETCVQQRNGLIKITIWLYCKKILNQVYYTIVIHPRNINKKSCSAQLILFGKLPRIMTPSISLAPTSWIFLYYFGHSRMEMNSFGHMPEMPNIVGHVFFKHFSCLEIHQSYTNIAEIKWYQDVAEKQNVFNKGLLVSNRLPFFTHKRIFNF